MVQSGEMIKNLTEVQIRDTLAELLNLNTPHEPLPKRIRSFMDAVRGKDEADR